MAALEVIRRLASDPRGGIAGPMEELAGSDELPEVLRLLRVDGSEEERVLALTALLWGNRDDAAQLAVPYLADEALRVRKLAERISSPEQRGESVQSTEDLLASEAWQDRIRAVAIIRARADADLANDVLVPLLEDPNAQVRRTTVFALKELNVDLDWDQLVQKARTAPSAADRAVALYALRGRSGPELVPTLRVGLEDESPWVRAEAAAAWSYEGSAGATLALMDRLAHEGTGMVRGALIAALERIGDAAAEPAIVHALASDGDPQVRLAAAKAAAAWSSPSICSALTAGLDDPEIAVCRQAAHSLGALRAEGARKALERLEAQSEDAALQAEALLALRRIEGQRMPEHTAPLVNPTGAGSAYASWYRESPAGAALTRLVFYCSGSLESFDEEDECVRHDFQVTSSGTLTIGSFAPIRYELRPDQRPDSQGVNRPCCSLHLSGDPFAESAGGQGEGPVVLIHLGGTLWWSGWIGHPS